MGREFQVIQNKVEILRMLDQVQHWLQDDHEHLMWTGQDLIRGQEPLEFRPGSVPLEAHILKVDGAPRAYCEMHHNKVGWLMARMVVHPEWRGQGLGRRLVEFCFSNIFKHSQMARLLVHADNTSAKALYLSMGFRDVFFAEADQLYIMQVRQLDFLRLNHPLLGRLRSSSRNSTRTVG